MENLRKVVAAFLEEYALYVLDKYLITYPLTFKVETYSCKDYYGIIFVTEDCRYDICHNYLLGDRLLINPKIGGFSDIPFKPETFSFLPKNIEVKEMDQTWHSTN